MLVEAACRLAPELVASTTAQLARLANFLAEGRRVQLSGVELGLRVGDDDGSAEANGA